MNETHPFQVSIWVSGNDNPKSIFERGHWMEYARCTSKFRADEIAFCLSLRHQAVQAAELVSDEHGSRFVGYKFIPESARTLR